MAHHLMNKGSEDVKYLDISSRIADDVVSYPYIDLLYLGGDKIFTE